MKKLISICLILSLAFLFASCDPNTSIQDSAKDPNVPPASEFKSEATDDELKLMAEMYKAIEVIDFVNYGSATYKCLDGATVSNQPASGRLELSTSGSDIKTTIKCTGSITIGGIKYSTDSFVVSATKTFNEETNEYAYSQKSYEGSITVGEKKETGEDAYNTAMHIIKALGENGKNIEISTEYKTTKDGYTINLSSSMLRTLQDKEQGEEYFKIENQDHKMTLGIKGNEDKKEFLYLSLDGKYFDESVYNKMITMK